MNPSPSTHTAVPYFIEVDANGCEKCSHGRMWSVVGPDGVASSTSYADEETAADLAEQLNTAYQVGLNSHASLIAQRDELVEACAAAEVVLSAIECGRDKPLATGAVLDQLRKSLAGQKGER
jgi:hypothetical protein